MLRIFIITTLLGTWWQITLDDWHYGQPRTYQIDAVVKHNNSPNKPSHFIAVNFHSRVEVIEWPGGDATKARMYLGSVLIGDNNDLIHVTLSFKNADGDGLLT